MSPTLKITIAVQAATFVVAAVLLFRDGNPKLGMAQALLAVITWLVYA